MRIFQKILTVKPKPFLHGALETTGLHENLSQVLTRRMSAPYNLREIIDVDMNLSSFIRNFKKPRMSTPPRMGRRKVHFAENLEKVFVVPADEVDSDEERDAEDTLGALSSEQQTATRRTSEVTVLSSLHGRARRELREITKFDLQEAVKYGEKTRGHPDPKTKLPRWKYTYANVVYITDHSSRIEVTSYRQAIHIQPACISQEMLDRHRDDCQTLKHEPHLCVTHSIIVIDQSGSMKISDVKGFRNRSEAAYGVLALEYIAEQLHQRGNDNVLDAASVIEMNDEATVVYEREPLDWILFNKILDRQNYAKPKSHGSYNKSVAAAKQLIENDIANSGNLDPEDLPVYSIIFLSDGRPSDSDDIYAVLRRHLLIGMARDLKSNFHLHTIGLGSADEDFGALRAMSACVSEAGYGSVSTFAHSQLSTAQLGAAFSTISNSMTATRTEAMSAGSNPSPRVKKDVQVRSKFVPRSERKFRLYNQGVTRWRYDHTKDTSGPGSWPWQSVFFKNKNAHAFHMEVEPFGKGAERLAYMFHEVDSNYRRLGKPMVAKETISVDDEERKVKFHETFCRVQHRARLFAEDFNRVVARTPDLKPKDASIRVPLVDFLKCFVYEHYVEEDDTTCGLLVEEYLEGKFTKYNSNYGYVRNTKGERKIELFCGDVYMTDFLQAFSHWVYYSTDQKFLICDLQGVLNMEGRRPRFMLTDPCICSRKKRGERRVFGRSDMGSKGFRMFRKNHVCNNVCKGLGLPAFGSSRKNS